MSKELNTAKGVVKKPPADTPAAGATGKTTAEINGKVVRKDAGVKPAPAPKTGDSPAHEKTKKPATAPIKGKVVRKDPPAQSKTQPLGEATIGFETPEEAEAAAEDILLGDDKPAVPEGTVAFMGETIDTESYKDTGEIKKPAPSAPEQSQTQAFTGATIDIEMPKSNAAPVGERTQGFSNETIDTDLSKEPAQRSTAPAKKPGGTAGVQKGASMATIFNERYKLLKELGKGGMGSVYKAEDVKFERIVAVKVLAKELSKKDAYVKRFEREGRVMIKLDHTNVIRCFDFDQDKKTGHYYLAIEFVEGGSVEGWLKKLGRFSLGDALHIILKAAEGLQHAHDKALIHRDVKPDNLLLTKDGIVKVADLGLAKDTEEDVSLTKTGAGAGTPIYMAPEQARDVKHVDCKVDIYALGVMLYVFLTGQPPFQGNTLVELISAKEKGTFEKMRKFNDEVPAKLDLIVDKMIAKDPKNRYASCQEVIDQIEPLGLANETLSFIDGEASAPAPAAKKPASKVAPTRTPGPLPAATSLANKGPAAKTSAPASAGDTELPTDEDTFNVWYWQFETPNGRNVTKKLSTEQVRTLIKSGHLDDQARLSKSEKAGFRGAATYNEFAAIFKSMRAATKANSRANSRGKMSDIIAEDERRRKYGWIGRLFKSTGSMLFGLLWIAVILGGLGVGGYFLWKYTMTP